MWILALAAFWCVLLSVPLWLPALPALASFVRRWGLVLLLAAACAVVWYLLLAPAFRPPELAVR